MPTLVPCPDCRAEISRRADVCPTCGRRFRNRQTAAGLLAAVVLGLLLYWIFATFVVPRIGL